MLLKYTYNNSVIKIQVQQQCYQDTSTTTVLLNKRSSKKEQHWTKMRPETGVCDNI